MYWKLFFLRYMLAFAAVICLLDGPVGGGVAIGLALMAWLDFAAMAYSEAIPDLHTMPTSGPPIRSETEEERQERDWIACNRFYLRDDDPTRVWDRITGAHVVTMGETQSRAYVEGMNRAVVFLTKEYDPEGDANVERLARALYRQQTGRFPSRAGIFFNRKRWGKWEAAARETIEIMKGAVQYQREPDKDE